MKEQLISYITALLAKEKGFIADCSYYYSNKDGKLKPFMYDDNPKVISLNDGIGLGLLTIAPTQGSLQAWLWEKHKIWVEITLWGDGIGFTCMIKYLDGNEMDGRYKGSIIVRPGETISAPVNKNPFEYLSELREKGLQVALKTIKS